MKLVVISDTHMEDRSQHLPQPLLKELKTADMAVHAGDIGSPSVLEAIRHACPNVKAVWGNMDHEPVRKQLHEKEIFAAGKYRIGLVHGHGSPRHLPDYVFDLFKHDRVDVIIFGHSHIPYCEKREGILVFNPGSPTDDCFSPYHSYGVIELGENGIDARIVKLPPHC